MIAARVVAAAGQLHGHAVAHLLLGRMMQSGGIKDGKVTCMSHVIRGQLHGRAEVVVVQQTSRRQAAQCCAGKAEEQTISFPQFSWNHRLLTGRRQQAGTVAGRRE